MIFKHDILIKKLISHKLLQGWQVFATGSQEENLFQYLNVNVFYSKSVSNDLSMSGRVGPLYLVMFDSFLYPAKISSVKLLIVLILIVHIM